jgi:hypothetical protein
MLWIPDSVSGTARLGRRIQTRTVYMIPLAAAPLLKASSPSGPAVLPTPMGAIQSGNDTVLPNMDPLVDTDLTLRRIRGLNQIFLKKSWLA